MARERQHGVVNRASPRQLGTNAHEQLAEPVLAGALASDAPVTVGRRGFGELFIAGREQKRPKLGVKSKLRRTARSIATSFASDQSGRAFALHLSAIGLAAAGFGILCIFCWSSVSANFCA